MNGRAIYAADLYSQLLASIGKRLNPLGFRKHGGKFLRKVSFGSLVISFQKSLKSTKDDIYFTADISILHTGLAKRLADLGFSTMVSSHYRQRVGLLLSPPRDQWWRISGSVKPCVLESDVWNVLENHAVPDLLQFKSEDALRDLWQSGRSPGLTEGQRIICLAALLKEMGRELELRKLEDDIVSNSGLTRKPFGMIAAVFDALRQGNQE